MSLQDIILKALGEEDEDYLGDNKMLSDGIYDVSNIEFIHVMSSLTGGSRKPMTPEKVAEIEEFVKKHKDTFVIGCAYETNNSFILATTPPPSKAKQYGGGFEGHGTSALFDLTDTGMTKILILGEND